MMTNHWRMVAMIFCVVAILIHLADIASGAEPNLIILAPTAVLGVNLVLWQKEREKK